MNTKENHSGGQLFNHNQMGGGSTPWINPPTAGPTQLAVDLEELSQHQYALGELLSDLDVTVQLVNGVDLDDVLTVRIRNGVVEIVTKLVTWRAATNSIQSFCHTTI